MSETQGTQDLGPLPQSDPNAALQRLSLKSFQALLRHQDTLIFRDERIEDYGVDGSLELKAACGVTNLRSQVQMKGTKSASPNADGSISHSISTSNLNYLCNGPCPIYVLYDEAQDAFWYIWAHDELQRIEAENAGWRKQTTVTLRFRYRLIPEALPAIWERTLKEGRFHRSIQDTLSRSTFGEPVAVSIDTANLEITDAESAQKILLASGTTIVGSGYAQEALRLSGLLSANVKAHPRIQLVLAYANYSLGRYHEARGEVGQALARGDELQSQDVLFLLSLRDACELRFGLIDMVTYISRAEKRIKGDIRTSDATTARIAQTRYQLMRERDLSKRAALHKSFSEAVESLKADPSVSDAAKLNARIGLLYADGAEGVIAVNHLLKLAEIGSNAGVPISTELAAEITSARQKVQEWEDAANQAVKEAIELKHPLLIGDALTTRLGIYIARLVGQKLDSLFTANAYVLPSNKFDELKRNSEDAQSLYRHAGCLEGELRAKLWLMQLYELRGDITKAKMIAAQIHNAAEAMGYADIAELAREVIEDRTTLMEAHAASAETRSADDDAKFATSSDDDVRAFAKDSLKAMGLPVARLPVVERDCFLMRSAARERMHWCRHLRLLENLEETSDLEIAYTTDPHRICECSLLNYRSPTPSLDGEALVVAFKRTRCSICVHRNPKGEVAPTVS